MSNLNENARIRHDAVRAGMVMVGLVAFGTGGYVLLEGWSVFEALYMTAITLSTIGFGEVRPLTETGRAFTLLLIITGVGNLAYALGATTEFFAAGGLDDYRRRARMERYLKEVHGHTIVCGYGRLGSAIVRELAAAKALLVIVERDPTALAELRELGVPFVEGDAGDDDVLHAAGIARAGTLVAALNDDAANVFLTLTARVLNPAVIIYGKAEDPQSLIKLERAGANVHFSPAVVAGHRVAMQILRPSITEVVDLPAGNGVFELAMQEVKVADLTKSERAAPLSPSSLWGTRKLMILAVKTASGEILFPAPPGHDLQADDRLVVMGEAKTVVALQTD